MAYTLCATLVSRRLASNNLATHVQLATPSMIAIHVADWPYSQLLKVSHCMTRTPKI